MKSPFNNMMLRKISGYSAVVSAALLLTPTHAEAKVNYVDPEDIIVNAENKYVDIDIDGDTVNDFRVELIIDSTISTFYYYYTYYSTLFMKGLLPQNMISTFENFVIKNQKPENLTTIGKWDNNGVFCMASASTYGNTNSKGYWLTDNDSKYIGVKFNISGSIHYGWVRASVNNAMGAMQITIHDWTYE